MVMHWWKEHLAFEFDYFPFLSSSQSSNKGFKDVGAFFVPEIFHSDKETDYISYSNSLTTI